MKVWILEIGEPLPLEKDVRLHRYGLFSQYLAQQGEDVTWWTSSFSHAPKKHFVDRDCEQMVNGVRMKFIHGPGYTRNVSFARIQHNKHFAARFRELAPQQPRPDLIIAPIPIIEAAFEAVQFAKAHNIPIITDIRDVWPDELKELAPKPLQPLARLLLHRAYKRMEFLCNNVSGVMGICQTYVNYGLQFCTRPQHSKDFVFPLGYSPKKVSEDKLAEARAWLQQQGLCTGEMNICFFGTIGKFFDLKTVIEAARQLPQCQFILAGDGSDLEKYKTMAQGVNNVVFPGWLKEPQIQAVMESSHVGLAPYRKTANMALPNKPFEYMAGGLAIVSSVRQELPEILKKYNCGLSYQADSAADLVEKLRFMLTHPQERVAMGQRGKDLFTAQYSTEIVFSQALNHLQKVAQVP